MWVREVAWIEPVDAASRLADHPGLSFLDSAAPDAGLGRHSFVAADPFGTFRVVAGRASWNGEALPGAPLEALRGLMRRYAVALRPDLPPFQGGAIGALDYEFGWLLDHGQGGAPEPAGETAHFNFYDVVVAFDHARRRAWICASGWPADTESEREQRAARRIAEMADRLAGAPPPRPAPDGLRWEHATDAATFCAAVERVQDYVRAGDVYQANVAQRFFAAVPLGADLFALYRRLRASNPAPFAAYLHCGPRTVLSSSPERFLRLADGTVEARPIKGTARRAADPVADAALGRALTGSAKDRAENVMIVDLLRNDLSRVCDAASVDVPVLCGLETYAGLHHLVSVVSGRLRERLDALDLIAATFPGGSITGAPKLRAMEIIAELEGTRRGLYCGAIGALGFDGGMDLNIAIRTIVVEEGRATLHAGGGVTILSDPAREYEETLLKARRIFDAFQPAYPADLAS